MPMFVEYNKSNLTLVPVRVFTRSSRPSETATFAYQTIPDGMREINLNRPMVEIIQAIQSYFDSLSQELITSQSSSPPEIDQTFVEI